MRADLEGRLVNHRVTEILDPPPEACVIHANGRNATQKKLLEVDHEVNRAEHVRCFWNVEGDVRAEVGARDRVYVAQLHGKIGGS